MDFQTAYTLGYYFDRCIDLDFYDSNHNLMASLYTPKQGMKPSITVKGELIEGSYAISSYISVQNMSYDININAVTYIKCRMYYSGLEESVVIPGGQNKVKNGHVIIFSVLYADQEKEPPNRAVRFQCTTAAFDYTRSAIPLKVSYSAEKLINPLSANVKVEGSGNQDKKEFFLIDVLSGLASLYNEEIKKEGGSNSLKKLNLADYIEITGIKYPSIAEMETIPIEEGFNTLGGILKYLSTIRTKWHTYKVVIFNGLIIVDLIPPDNWKEIFMRNGIPKEDWEIKYSELFLDKEIRTKAVGGASVDSSNKEVPLNYIKSAYRNENVITVSTIFDDRVYPGCISKISGNAVMGKHKGGGKKSGSRIVNYTDTEVTFRATGGIEYEFSTTEGSSMTFQGPVISEIKKSSGGKDITIASVNAGGI